MRGRWEVEDWRVKEKLILRRLNRYEISKNVLIKSFHKRHTDLERELEKNQLGIFTTYLQVS